MKIMAIKAIASRISRKYFMIDLETGKPLVNARLVNKNLLELRTELTLDEGGHELSEAITLKFPDLVCEPAGGCVYNVYKPL